MDYYTRFGTSIKNYRDEFTMLNELPKKRRTKQLKQIKQVQSLITSLEEHEYFLEQLVNNKDLIDDEKIDNIREDMDNFLLHPNTDILREELKAEYQHMFEDINQFLDEQKIEEQKFNVGMHSNYLNFIGHEETADASLTLGFIDFNESDKPKTRKEIREERLKKEQQMVGFRELQYVSALKN